MNARHVIFAVAPSVLVMLPLTGCEKPDEPATYRQSRQVMGTFAEVTSVAPDKATARAAVEAAYARLSDVNRLMSDHVADSEVGRLNALSAGESMVVSAETFHVLQAASGISEASRGALDITCRPLVQLWKRAAKEGKLPDESEIQATITRVGWQRLTLNPSTRTVTKKPNGMQIDLGAVAKGYALDLAAEAMQKAGATSGLVDVGGDVRTFGPRGDGVSPWIIGVKHPFRGGLFGKLAIQDRAVATSGVQQRFHEIDGKLYSHIIDPRTGQPARQAPSVTVIAPDGLTADAWATVFSVLSVEEGKPLADQLTGIEVMWIWGSVDDPKTAQTDGFEHYLMK